MSTGGGQRDRWRSLGDDQVEGFAGDVALQDPQNLVAAVALGSAFRGERSGRGVVDEAVVRDGPECVVRGSVTAAVEAVTLSLPAAGLDRAGPTEGGERSVAV
jgi:hypothetical protein